jgi:deazaflavin-dependent oxidoreductase (nitroreductase family)
MALPGFLLTPWLSTPAERTAAMGLNEWNRRIIDEFRTNDGRNAGDFEGVPMIIVHHIGRKSGKTYENPLVYQPGPNGRMYLIGSFGGAPTDPAWFHNLLAAGRAKVEVAGDTFEVTATEVTGTERDEVFAKQKAALPAFGEYEKKTEGVRTIPVLALDRL